MNIIRLKIEDVMRIVAVDIEPGGSLVVVGGRNAQGKTSTLDAIAMALGGGRLIPATPIKKGQTTGKVEVTLDDLVVTRSFWYAKDGSTRSKLTVTSRDGSAEYKKPQDMLDRLCGSLAFDPLKFARDDPQKQLEALQELVGLDFEEHDAKRVGTFNKRADANREEKRLGAVVDAMPIHHGVSEADRIGTEGILSGIAEITEHNERVGGSETRLATTRATRTAVLKSIADIEAQIETLTADLAGEKIVLAEVETSIKETAALLGSQPRRDAGSLKAKLDESADIERKLAENAARSKARHEHTKALAIAGTLTDTLSLMDADKKAAIAAAKMPVEGLGFADGCVTFNGLPFAQASSAEQLRISVALGLAANPTLTILLVRDGSLLDEDNLAMIAQMAAAAEAQVWVERVGTEGCSFVIEDGRVLEEEGGPT